MFNCVKLARVSAKFPYPIVSLIFFLSFSLYLRPTSLSRPIAHFCRFSALFCFLLTNSLFYSIRTLLTWRYHFCFHYLSYPFPANCQTYHSSIFSTYFHSVLFNLNKSISFVGVFHLVLSCFHSFHSVVVHIYIYHNT